MILNDRQTEMLNALKTEKRMSVSSLAKRFFVSDMTVRRDLKLLESEGYIKRYKGGAVCVSDESLLPIEMRMYIHADQKSTLAKRTVKYLHDSMNVFIGCSTTCMYVIPLLAEYKDVKIVTNSVQTVMAASERNIPCTLIGGEYIKHEMCTVGGAAESALRNMNIDISFLSSASLSDDGIISDSYEALVSLRKAVIGSSDIVVALMDSHKLHKKSLYTLCRAEDVTELIIL